MRVFPAYYPAGGISPYSISPTWWFDVQNASTVVRVGPTTTRLLNVVGGVEIPSIDASPGQEPGYTTASGAGHFGTHPVLQYTGGQLLTGAFASGLVAQPWTIVCVAQGNIGGNIVLDSASADPTKRIAIVDAANWSAFAGNLVASATASNVPAIVVIRANGASSELIVYPIAGGKDASVVNAGTNGTNGVSVGARVDGVGFFTGYFAEGYGVPRLLDDATLDLLAAYERRKWS